MAGTKDVGAALHALARGITCLGTRRFAVPATELRAVSKRLGAKDQLVFLHGERYSGVQSAIDNGVVRAFFTHRRGVTALDIVLRVPFGYGRDADDTHELAFVYRTKTGKGWLRFALWSPAPERARYFVHDFTTAVPEPVAITAPKAKPRVVLPAQPAPKPPPGWTKQWGKWMRKGVQGRYIATRLNRDAWELVLHPKPDGAASIVFPVLRDVLDMWYVAAAYDAEPFTWEAAAPEATRR